MCNFHVGQKVVYIGKDRTFDPNPGKTVHTIQAMKKGCCGIEIDVGKRNYSFYDLVCLKCGHRELHTGVRWKHDYVFRPLVEGYTEEEIEAVNIDELVEPFLEPVHNG
jgi:hypothetical protein